MELPIELFFAGKNSKYIYLITKNGIFSSHVLGAILPFSLIFFICLFWEAIAEDHLLL